MNIYSSNMCSTLCYQLLILVKMNFVRKVVRTIWYWVDNPWGFRTVALIIDWCNSFSGFTNSSFADFNVMLLSQVTGYHPSSIRWANPTIKTKMVKFDVAKNQLVYFYKFKIFWWCKDIKVTYRFLNIIFWKWT